MLKAVFIENFLYDKLAFMQSFQVIHAMKKKTKQKMIMNLVQVVDNKFIWK